MGYPGADLLCCPQKAISGFGAVGARHFAPARPVSPTEYTTLERQQGSMKGFGDTLDQYIVSKGNMYDQTATQYELPPQVQLVDEPIAKSKLSKTDWVLIGAGIAAVAAGIYISRKP